MDTQNRKYENLRTGKTETSYGIGYAFTKDCYESSEPGNETMNPDETEEEFVIAEGNSVANQDPDYIEA